MATFDIPNLPCPQFANEDGSLRCGAAIRVLDESDVESTDGPIKHLKIRCTSGHFLNAPAEHLWPPAALRALFPRLTSNQPPWVWNCLILGAVPGQDSAA